MAEERWRREEEKIRVMMIRFTGNAIGEWFEKRRDEEEEIERRARKWVFAGAFL